MNTQIILAITAITGLVAIIVIGIVIIVKLNESRREGSRELENRLRDEIDRSRQETVEMVQSSVKNMGDVLAKNQIEAANQQSRRIVELNTQFTESMAQINKNLGEMQTLTTGVSDLNRMLSNVKSRGIVGEVQLGAILENVLSPDQYEENIQVTGTTERVEFAVKFPGEGDEYVYLPIDSKFPGDAYINLLDAYDEGDKEEIKQSRQKLKNAINLAARDIKNKYIYPPKTTEFAVMFLPFEGLYAEVLRLDMVEKLQNEYRVNVAGPTTMAAMLNSFQMGFKSLALQKSSGEVWDTLSKVKTEFDKYSEQLVKTQGKLDVVQKELETLVGTRTRSIQRVLRNVSEIGEE